MSYKLVSDYTPKGDQISAVEKLNANLVNHKQMVLLGATGTGKTFTIANIIAKLKKKTLILAHNKTLAGQLYGELKTFFPESRVEFFISYYDYYQPEAYVVSKDLYIDKDSSINEEIDELRHSAISSLLDSDDCIVVASVSCIYGIGSKEDYQASLVTIRVGDQLKRRDLIKKLVALTYVRNDLELARGTFRVKGDTLDIILSGNKAQGLRISFFGDEIESISTFEVSTGRLILKKELATIFPATLFVSSKDKLQESIKRIKAELQTQINYFESQNKLLEAQRIKQRTIFDLEMLEETGIVSGIENYARHIALRGEGETPDCLIDYFGKDFLMIIDESHATIPQVRGMYNGDRSRKTTLVDYGFRLPSALDNRPLTFHEFEEKLDKVIYLSATPGEYELSKNLPVIEQIIRPTYLLDPLIEIRPTTNQIDDLYFEIKKRMAVNERVLVTTLTIKMSEILCAYFKNLGLKVAYLHSEIKSLERIVILRDLRLGKYDCLIGINLLREGLDLPEVSLVCILDADKQGFLRSERSLIQTIGRSARNVHGMVIMYADKVSEAMAYAIKETNRRRDIQLTYNQTHGVTPVTINKAISQTISLNTKATKEDRRDSLIGEVQDLNEEIKLIETLMKEAAKSLDFEKAAELRDILFELKSRK
ncbi:MAG: excinuclease ABC subunit UvrB [Acholeplasmatales bacterium]|jgi:excinuclease ABC subunit B|nr:excinuclease ABC subunit UvrB [Acholeplasmatales bacterium]